MTSSTPIQLDREFTLSQINWKRTLTDIDMKRRKADMRERDRMQFRIIDKITSPTLSFELENFKLFGKLNKTETHIHNTIPTTETVAAEKDYIEFDKMRKSQPQAVTYTSFYKNIQGEVKKPKTPKTPSAIAFSGIEKQTSSEESRGQSRAALRNSSQAISSSTPSHILSGTFSSASVVKQSTPIFSYRKT
ncbi:uncharacterized protein LOC128228632 isoform X1 [Mya arenaria]|uniref:uncharacterized protein LOC128228632 isoform X1 n=1 Tax=Mya arenaria TaxID=6604 RepID=UPI0022E48FC5|nr:uncharacterized protein LOC128228632 isoform X1 [Mya arenaria]